MGSESVAEVIAGINLAGREYAHCQKIFDAAHSEAVLESYSVSLKETIARIVWRWLKLQKSTLRLTEFG